jgi:hypothetical protein
MAAVLERDKGSREAVIPCRIRFEALGFRGLQRFPLQGRQPKNRSKIVGGIDYGEFLAGGESRWGRADWRN